MISQGIVNMSIIIYQPQQFLHYLIVIVHTKHIENIILLLLLGNAFRAFSHILSIWINIWVFNNIFFIQNA
jgi:hypothetical protein